MELFKKETMKEKIAKWDSNKFLKSYLKKGQIKFAIVVDKYGRPICKTSYWEVVGLCN